MERPRRACAAAAQKASALKLRRAGAIRRKTKPTRIAKQPKTRREPKIKKLPITQKRQSPIDIRSEHIEEDPETCQVDSLNITYTMGDCCDVITGPTGFRVNVRKNCTTKFEASHLPACYELAQFHAHWSGDGSCGSEHMLDGKAMSAEVHFVFWNTTYGSFCKAVEQEDGLAVIGVFLKEGKRSENYQPLIDCIRKARESDQAVSMPKDFVLEQLFPPVYDREFATYLGSLTTPPFSESVIWTVLIHPVEVSKEQLDVLRSIVPANFRECQALCERPVRCSRAIRA